LSRRRWAFALILLGLVILADQLVFWRCIDWDQVLHHEFFAGVSLALGAGILLGDGGR